ncbi:hypothetical protein N7468_010623 [Penicillium chermesinum]|uniref:Uncharacterized protein n=1 Tax=Penicillium chermesinum TaxID=63820 RepID=A0A9W9N9F3_9EURO|nr:uncharacterized protein N7468_010623 [Penicillium chermesinum]KAJ5214944.1 hypothetical protein N7468_010623 [Penicillium chermesinum]
MGEEEARYRNDESEAKLAEVGERTAMGLGCAMDIRIVFGRGALMIAVLKSRYTYQGWGIRPQIPGQDTRPRRVEELGKFTATTR